MTRASYPLQWPEGWLRTPTHQRRRSKFEATYVARDRDSILSQLRRMGSSRIVITSNLPTRSDGLLYASANGLIADPGIAVWWVRDGREQVMACDRWIRAEENLHAIELSLEALRGLERWGSTAIVERAFAGFAALPPGAPEPVQVPAPAKRPWREVLCMNRADLISLEAEHQMAIAKACHRRLIADAHPDAGGSHQAAAEINAALAEAEEELSRG